MSYYLQFLYKGGLTMNKMRLKDYNSLITVSTHNHIGGDKFDAVDITTNYIDKFIECGYKKAAATGHGGFSAMQTALDYSKKTGFEIIYGLEAYIEVPPFKINEKVGHLILLAKDEEGKHIIDRLNSNPAAKKGEFPVLTWKQLKSVNFNGHVVAQSACIAGAPAIRLLANDMLEQSIKNLEQSFDSLDKNGDNVYMSSQNILYIDILNKINDVNKDITQLNARKKEFSDEVRVLQRRLKDIQKKGGDVNSADESTQIRDINIKIDNTNTEIKSKKEQLSSFNSVRENYQKKIDKWEKVLAHIEDLKSRCISKDEEIAACRQTLEEYNNLFGKGNYYAEVQYHGLDAEKYVYPIIADLAKDLNIPIIAANDAHMVDNSKKSLDIRNVAHFLRFETINETEADKELYIKTPNQLADKLLEILSPETVDEAMMNLNVLGEQCHYIQKIKSHYPKFDKNADSNVLLRKEAEKGIEWRFPNRIGWTDVYEKRLEYELNVIINMGFADYHLIVKEFLEYARICGKVPADKLSEVPLTIEGALEYVKKHNYTIGIGVGPGRGSGAGSLVTFLLGITSIDPIKYNLIFERFLNPERISMPDIDSDIAYGVREKAIQFVRNKYGDDAVVGIITESREGVKGAIRDVARYYGMKYKNDTGAFLGLGNMMRKKVPKITGITFDTKTDSGETVYDYLHSEFSENPDAIEILNISRNIEGMLVSYGQHAAGVIIYDNNDISEYIPVRMGNLGIKTTECDMIQAEALKLLKMDFLGLRTLNILTDTARLVKETQGIDLDIENIPVDDAKAMPVYQNIYAKGKTKNVFQFESPGMRKYLKELFKTA